jgi:hypothetical protein
MRTESQPRAAAISLDLSGETTACRNAQTASVDHLIIAGWTGRDPAAMEAHMAELEKIGIARPKIAPIFYRVAATLLTTAPDIQVLGTDSSGEVEPVLMSLADGLWLGVGSDHTDRKVETIGISISKQLCPKPISTHLWRFDELRTHWDDLVVRCFAIKDGQRRLYQEGTLAKMRHPEDLMTRHFGKNTMPAGTAMFCGTLAVHGKIEPADAYELEIEDPVLNRRIVHHYAVRTLPVEG